MPPLFHDPLSAVPEAAWRFADAARALIEVSCEVWALALIGLAVYSFLEREVKGVMKAVLPLVVALAAAGAVALAARALAGVPRPLAGTGQAIGTLLRRAFPSEHAAAVAAFATYTALAYGRRALAIVLAAAALGLGRAMGGAHWVTEIAAGGISGALVAVAAYGLTVRLVPHGHVARLREARREKARAAFP